MAPRSHSGAGLQEGGGTAPLRHACREMVQLKIGVPDME